MRFTATSVFLGVASAAVAQSSVSSWAKPSVSTSVVYETQTSTIWSCPPEVTNCPEESIKVVTSVVAVSTTECPIEESWSEYGTPTATPSPVWSSSEVAWPTGGSSCWGETETCTVTVTKPKPVGTGGPWVPSKNATATAWATGTGSPVWPSPSYYSNAASSLKGGALALGAGALALLAL